MICDRRTVMCGLSAAICLPSSLVRAQQLRLGPYTRAELEAVRGTYQPYLRGPFFEDLLGRLPPAMRSQLGDVQLDLPTEMPAGLGGDPSFVLAVGAIPAARQVILPLRTALWLEEYCGLTAELERRKCSSSLVLALTYAAMLTRGGQGDIRPPGPLTAFGLSQHVYNDAYVKDVSNKLFGSTVFFLLAHELGHIGKRHRTDVAGINSQMQEREADAYALDAMANVGLMPVGLAIFFATAAMMEGSQTTHPLSGSRAGAIAQDIEARPRAFVDRSERNPDAWVPRLLDLARQVREVMPLVDDPKHRFDILKLGAGATFAQLSDLLANLCPSQ